MNLNGDEKKAVNELGDAINLAIGKSREVAAAIERLRVIGYEPHLAVKLEIALDKISPVDDDFTPDDDENSVETVELNLTADDLRTLQKMGIKF